MVLLPQAGLGKDLPVQAIQLWLLGGFLQQPPSWKEQREGQE